MVTNYKLKFVTEAISFLNGFNHTQVDEKIIQIKAEIATAYIDETLL